MDSSYVIPAAAVVIAAVVGLVGVMLAEFNRRSVAEAAAAIERERLRLDNWERLAEAHARELARKDAEIERLVFDIQRLRIIVDRLNEKGTDA